MAALTGTEEAGTGGGPGTAADASTVGAAESGAGSPAEVAALLIALIIAAPEARAVPVPSGFTTSNAMVVVMTGAPCDCTPDAVKVSKAVPAELIPSCRVERQQGKSELPTEEEREVGTG